MNLLPTGQAATLLGLSPRTLERYRCTGFGPRFVKQGRRISYRAEDLDAWITSRICQSTSERRTTR